MYVILFWLMFLFDVCFICFKRLGTSVLCTIQELYYYYYCYYYYYYCVLSQDLIHDLKSELSGNLEEIILAMFVPIPEYDAHQVHKAIKVKLFTVLILVLYSKC